MFVFCIDHHDLHGPVSKGKAGNATVSARSVENIVSEVGLKEVSRITPDELRVANKGFRRRVNRKSTEAKSWC